MYGKKIKEFLDKNGIKYSFIAHEIGIANNVFSSILHEKRKISVEEYFAICETLKVDANYFSQTENQAS